MNKTEKITLMEGAYSLLEQETKNTYIFNEKVLNTSELKEIFEDIQYSLDEGIPFDLDYEIMAKACDIVSTIYNEENGDFYSDRALELQQEMLDNAPSVYTGIRLDYLTAKNQYDITCLLKEYECEDIASACALWYSHRVDDAVIKLIEWVNE